MKALSLVKKLTKVGNISLEDGLSRLCQFGKPRLSYMGDGWYCSLDMYVTGKGVEFKIASDFKHATPIEATKSCIERMETALMELGVSVEES